MTERFITRFGAANRKNAFSLVEVVIAMAVTSFGIVTILSLMPIGVHTALESRGQTRAAYLAEQIVSDLRSSSFTNASILYVDTNTPDAPLTALTSFSLGASSTNCLQCDGANNVLATATSAQYTAGVSSADVNYLVQITVTPSVIDNLSTVSVEISTPAQAALTVRSRFGFQTMIGNRQ